MLFSSYTFLLFFAVVLIVARFPWSWRGKKFFLLAMSYVFYAAWNPPFVILLWVSTVCDWFLAKWMHTSTSTAVRRLLLLCSLIVNLGLLAYFKYAGFAVETVSATLNAAGIPWHPAAPNIILPVGISFYTFQTLSYSLDVYRRKTEPSRNFLDFALFVTFFPQLVAGPIVRAVDFLPQLIEPKMASKKQLGWGLTMLDHLSPS